MLTDAGVTVDRVRRTLEQVVGRGFCAEDAAALRSVGIDLDQVRWAAEASFGPGALDRPLLRRCSRKSIFRRRRRRIDDVSGEVPFMPRAKRALVNPLAVIRHERFAFSLLALRLHIRSGGHFIRLVQRGRPSRRPMMTAHLQ